MIIWWIEIKLEKEKKIKNKKKIILQFIFNLIIKSSAIKYVFGLLLMRLELITLHFIKTKLFLLSTQKSFWKKKKYIFSFLIVTKSWELLLVFSIIGSIFLIDNHTKHFHFYKSTSKLMINLSHLKWWWF